MKKNTLRLPWNSAVFVLMLFLLTVGKSLLFYSGLHLANFELPFALATGGILLLVYLIFFPLSPKAAIRILTILYVFASVLMAVDAVYYAYVSKLPSAAQLGMVGQLTDISATILNLIRPRHVLMIFDLPLWVLWKANREEILAKLSRTGIRDFLEKLAQSVVPRKKMLLAGLAIVFICALTILVFPEFEAEYMINELFCYHVNDIVTTVSAGNTERGVDKSKYASPDYSGGEFYGLAEGRNVFLIQVEAMQNFVIGASYEGQEIMPNLNALITGDSFYFDHYYYQIGGGNTADAEFAVNNSLFAPESEAAYVKYPELSYHGLPYLLKEHGYTGAHAYHNYIGSFWNREEAYPNQGFDDFTSLEDMEETDMFNMGLSDKEMFRQSMERIKTYEEPFYCFYVTVSSHHPYAIPLKDREIALKEEDEATLFGLYLQAMNYADRAIGSFIAELKEAGLYENSVILIYGDHYALTNTDPAVSSRVSELIGRQYTIYDVFNVPFIVNIPGMKHGGEVIHTAGGHMDVLPTLLCLLGITNDKAVMFGQNLLEADSGFVCEQTHVSVGSFISDEVFFQKPHNNIKSNYNAYEKGTMNRLDPDRFRKLSELAADRIADCAALLASDDIRLD